MRVALIDSSFKFELQERILVAETDYRRFISERVINAQAIFAISILGYFIALAVDSFILGIATSCVALFFTLTLTIVTRVYLGLLFACIPVLGLIYLTVITGSSLWVSLPALVTIALAIAMANQFRNRHENKMMMLRVELESLDVNKSNQ